MKRDMELVVKILNYLSDKADFDSPITPEVKGFSENQVYYHIKLMAQANLVEAKDWSTGDGPEWVVTSLTNKGHDFLDIIRQESVWSTVKSEFKESSLETVISVSKDLAEGWAKKKVEALLSGNS